jgi:hypothetical protein
MSAPDWLLELAAAAAIVTALVLLLPYGDIPDRIPRHFGASGDPDAWGDKSLLLWLTGLNVLLYAGMTVGSRFPHRFNYPWPITHQNASQQYRLARRLLMAVKGAVAWIFTYITYATVQTASGEAEGLGAGFLPFALGITFVPVAAYFVLAYRCR